MRAYYRASIYRYVCALISYGFVKEPSKPMSSVAALGDGVDGTDVVVDPLPVIRENGRRQSLQLF
jgi:hypothetical protein